MPHFFPFAGHLVLSSFILERKVFAKAGRILGSDERKGGLVVKQDLHGNFRVNVTMFFPLFLRSPRLNRAHSGIDGKIPSLCTN